MGAWKAALRHVRPGLLFLPDHRPEGPSVESLASVVDRSMPARKPAWQAGGLLHGEPGNFHPFWRAARPGPLRYGRGSDGRPLLCGAPRHGPVRSADYWLPCGALAFRRQKRGTPISRPALIPIGPVMPSRKAVVERRLQVPAEPVRAPRPEHEIQHHLTAEGVHAPTPFPGMHPLRAGAEHELGFFGEGPGLLEKKVGVPFRRRAAEHRRYPDLQFQPVSTGVTSTAAVGPRLVATRQIPAGIAAQLDHGHRFRIRRLRPSRSRAEQPTCRPTPIPSGSPDILVSSLAHRSAGSV